MSEVYTIQGTSTSDKPGIWTNTISHNKCNTMLYLDDCQSCIWYNFNGTCGSPKGEASGTLQDSRASQPCRNRVYYTREATRHYKKKRKIESVYDYELV